MLRVCERGRGLTLESVGLVVDLDERRRVAPEVASVDRCHLNGLTCRSDASVVDLRLVDIDCDSIVNKDQRRGVVDVLSAPPRPTRLLGPG
jgi:hypothetical protein